jgi:hypothetical protein
MSIQIAAAALVRQFTAALDMLDHTIANCPDAVWNARMYAIPAADLSPDFSQCWYVIYHTLFFTDLYLDESGHTFKPPEPFTLSEMDPAGLMPPRTYAQDELRAYLAHVRAKCITKIGALDAERAALPSTDWLNCGYFERQVYNLRHLHEHLGAVNLFAGQSGIDAKWVSFGHTPDTPGTSS